MTIPPLPPRGTRSAHEEGSSSLLQKIASLQAALEESQRLCQNAQASSIAKDTLLSNMGHELRTPLTAILGFTEVIADTACDEQTRADGLASIRQNSEHLLSVINEVLALSETEATPIVVDNLSISPSDIARHAVSLFAGAARAKGLQIDIVIDANVPAQVRSDANRLTHILSELLDNAVTFTASGRIDVRVQAEQSASDPGWTTLRFHVTDSGIGIHPDRLQDPFDSPDPNCQTGESAHSGLKRSRDLARLLGGDIVVARRPGRGSTFTLTLLIEVGSEQATMLQAGPLSMIGKPIPDERPRMLIVEDHPDNARLLRFYLKHASLTLWFVQNGQEALDFLAAETAAGHAWPLILLDMQMPVLDGYQTARALTQRGFKGRIVALTAHALTGDREACIAAGCHDYLSKPFSRDTVLEAVQRNLAILYPTKSLAA